jgi:hypothetical protein
VDQKSVGDLVVDRLHEMRHLVRDELKRRYKKTTFREKKLTDREKLQVYDRLEVDDIRNLINEFGMDSWDKYRGEMQNLRSKVNGR